jgi:hypothetical protein
VDGAVSHQQHHAQLQQWREFEADDEDRQVEEANALVQEMQDAEFRASIEDKFPILKGWK